MNVPTIGRITPTIGRIVLYTLGAIDAELINNSRRPVTGLVVSVGNKAQAGDVFPAMVVRVFPGADVVNLQVLLDGNDTYWATSVSEGPPSEQRAWHWPPRV